MEKQLEGLRYALKGRQTSVTAYLKVKAGSIYVGTSGWSYKSWAREFYPADLSPGKHLRFYVTRFPTVEINRTFYRLPTEKALDEWKRAAPEGFLYSLTGSRA